MAGLDVVIGYRIITTGAARVVHVLNRRLEHTLSGPLVQVSAMQPHHEPALHCAVAHEAYFKSCSNFFPEACDVSMSKCYVKCFLI